MDLKIKVPLDPTVGYSRSWLKCHVDKSEFTSSDMPFIHETTSPVYISIRYWTLDPILHKFLKTYNIGYSLEYIRDANWFIKFSSKKDMMIFKLYWVSAEDVYNNFKD